MTNTALFKYTVEDPRHVNRATEVNPIGMDTRSDQRHRRCHR